MIVNDKFKNFDGITENSKNLFNFFLVSGK